MSNSGTIDLFSADNILSSTGIFVLNNPTSTVKDIILEDWLRSSKILVLTGYSSLEYLLSIFGKERAVSNSVEIVLGNEPAKKNSLTDFSRPTRLSQEYKAYWLERGISILNLGNLLRVVNRIDAGEIAFKLNPKLHGKVYISDKSALMGSSNLSRTGFELNYEVNARFSSAENEEHYLKLKDIAEFYATEASDITDDIRLLFYQLLQAVTWREALARGISEILEGHWMKNYLDLISRYQTEKLWPTQIRAIAQALYIIDQEGSVLIAEPTGAGKTKIGSYLIRILYDRFNRRGMGHVTNYAMITPPTVMEQWNNEVFKIGTLAQVLSQGKLSKGNKDITEQIRRSNIMLIDEAHNYLNRKSGRSKYVAQNLADHVLLFTATPINKKSHDLLRIIELLGPDNLNAETSRDFDKLKSISSRSMHSEKELENLRRAISKVMVRHTKRQINQFISTNPDAFRNKQGKLCKYPKQVSKFYDVDATPKDEIIAQKINSICENLLGLAYLTDWRDTHRNASLLGLKLDKFVEIRLKNASALAVYRIKNALRSSKLALIEHLKGTEFAFKSAGLKKIKNAATGNVIKKHSELTVKNIEKEVKSLLPDWLTSPNLFDAVRNEEIRKLEHIFELATALTTSREEKKAKHLLELMKHHNKVLAYDSYLIATAFIQYLVDKNSKGPVDVIQISGEAESKEKTKFKDRFDFGSTASDKCIAICTDAVSEGINLQQASAVVFLDMPTVIRKAEQRAGRVDRLDSPHKEIEVFWPRDSRAFLLKTDRKFQTRLDIVERVIGSNLFMPEDDLELFYVNAEEFAKEYEKKLDSEDEIEWEGLEDAFAPVKRLVGTDGIIDDQLYQQFKSVNTVVVSRVSCVKDTKSWGLFALRGNETHAPQWILIDDKRNVITDLANIVEFIQSRIDKLEDGVWDDNTQKLTRSLLLTLKRSARQLLPNRKKLLFDLIEKKLKKKRKGDTEHDQYFNKLRSQFNQLNPVRSTEEEILAEKMIDWYELGHQLLDLIVKDKRYGHDRLGKKSIRLKHLIREIFNDPEMLLKIANQMSDPPQMAPFEHRIVSAIIAVKC